MKFKWPLTKASPEPPPAETTLAVDHEGIPILHEVVEPDALQPADNTNPDQADLPLFDAPADVSAGPNAVDLDAVRQELRNELLEVIEQTVAAVAERFREDLEQSLREELTRALDERLLKSIYREHCNDPE
ncbi:hypothetical protein [Sedimenticola hydrogenitrophicus]|uniref:hypothetical protein n=1 Tax=Sedimenticola hydrogenitrophicus TaxID=2967975 RepID=UPI0021A95D99|nr:hypothetical protein [Sedimenticola hydrogenitrophicus]